MNAFKELSSLPVSLTNSIQGVTTDGTYWYVTDTAKLYKINSLGSIVASRTISSDGTTSHIGDLTYDNSKLYVASGNYPTNTLAYVMEYDLSLNYITEYQTSNSKGAGAVTYDSDSGHFFVSHYFDEVKEFDTSWNLVDTYPVPTGLLSGSFNWDGIALIDGQVYLNPHSSMYPELIARFNFDSGDLVFDKWIMRPFECTQGMHWDSANELMYIARRGTNNEITTTKGVTIMDAGYAYDGNTVQTSSTSYVENSANGFTASIDVEDGDLIEITLTGIFKVTANNVRAYPHTADANTVAMTEVSNGPTIRTNYTATDGQTHSTSKVFRADEAGTAQFSMQWKMQTSGTANCITRILIAKKIGTET